MKKLPRGLAAVPAVVVVFLLLKAGLDSAARGYLGAWLTRELHVPAAVGSVGLNPFRGRVSFRDLRLEQPAGFGLGPAFAVERGSIRIRVSSLFSGPLVFEVIDLEGVEIRLVRNQEGKFNTGVLFPSSPESPEEEEDEGSENDVLIRSGTARGIFCSYADAGAGAEVSLREGELAVSGLALGGEEEPGGMGGRVVLTGLVRQEEAEAWLGLAGRVGRIGEGIPRLRAALRLYGLETGTLDGFFPPPGPRIMGEEGFDLAADLRLSPEELNGSLKLSDWTGQEEGLEVRGRPADPEVELSAGLSVFLRHYGDRAGGWAEQYTGETGGRVVTTAVSTVAAAGGGVVQVISSVGSGLYNIGKGIIKRDAAHAARGAAAAGTGAARGAVKTVTGPGEALADGTGLRRAARGEAAFDRWRCETGTRWSRDWDRARDSVLGE